MRRLALYLRSIVEAMAGFFLLLGTPFLALDLVRGHTTTPILLIGFFIICALFLLGLLLFRDAVQLRLRLQAEAKR